MRLPYPYVYLAALLFTGEYTLGGEQTRELRPVVLTEPIFITENTESISLVFNADAGSGALKNLPKGGAVYAHTGVITEKSRHSSDWKYATRWGDNRPKYRLERLGKNGYHWQINTNLRHFFGVRADEKIRYLAVVFRNLRGNRIEKGGGRSDILIPVYEEELNAGFPARPRNLLVPQGTSIDLEYRPVPNHRNCACYSTVRP